MLDIYQSSGYNSVSTRPSVQHELFQEQPTACCPQISTDQMADAIQVLKCMMKNATELLQASDAGECADAFVALIHQGMASLNNILFKDERRNGYFTTDSQEYVHTSVYHNVYSPPEVHTPAAIKGKKRARESEEEVPDSRPNKILRLTEEIDAFFEKYGDTITEGSSQTTDDEIEEFFNFHAGLDIETLELPTFMAEQALGKNDDGYQLNAQGEPSSLSPSSSCLPSCFEAVYTESLSFGCNTDYSGLAEVPAAVPEDELSPENLLRYLKYAVGNKTSDSISEGLTSNSTSASNSDITNAPSTSAASTSTAPSPSRRERAKLYVERRMSAKRGLQYVPFIPSRLRDSISWCEVVEGVDESGFLNNFEICAST